MSYAEIYQELVKELEAGRTTVLATVIETKGSTPRKSGSRMVVKADGSLFGTVGGGCGEAGVIQKARLSITDGQMRQELADLTEDISMETEAVCGGTFRVLIQPWQPTPDEVQLAHHLARFAEGQQEVVLHQTLRQDVEGELSGEITLLDGQGRPCLPAENIDRNLPSLPLDRPTQITRQGQQEIYSERWEPQPTLVIVGAGHIAEPLEAMARMAGFKTVVVDDRRLFANRERFPLAHQVVSGPILDVVREVALDRFTYMVLVTRGHTLDMDALRVVIDRGEPMAYLGMIGSIRRIRAVFQLLEEQGYPRQQFQHVHAPVGLDIRAETPAEIALAVLAEMVATRRNAGRDTRPMVAKHDIHPALRALPGKKAQQGE